MKPLKTIKVELSADTETAKAYHAMTEEYSVAHELIAARTRAGLSQNEVAQRMGTTQSAIARMESGKRPPSMSTMQRFAQAVGGHMVLRIEQAG